MSSCTCENPTDYRATSENGGDDYLYLRCADCGGKAGRVRIDIDDLCETITDPTDLHEGNRSVDISSVSDPAVSIHFDFDSPFQRYKGDNPVCVDCGTRVTESSDDRGAWYCNNCRAVLPSEEVRPA